MDNLDNLTIEGIKELRENFNVLNELEYPEKNIKIDIINVELNSLNNILNFIIDKHKNLLNQYYEELNKYSNQI